MSDIITRPFQPASLVPHNMSEAMKLAEIMASSRMLPKHFNGDVGTCFMIIEQAMRWNMSPFAVASCTSNIHGKLMFEGKLVAAAVISCGAIIGEFDYNFQGDAQKPETLSVTVSATRTSDRKLKTITLAWKDARTEQGIWIKQPEQQLTYAGVRAWARRWTPSAMLGVYAPDEMTDNFIGQTIDGTVSTSSGAGGTSPPDLQHVAPDAPAPEPGHPSIPPAFLERCAIAIGKCENNTQLLKLLKRIAPDIETMTELENLCRIERIRQFEKHAPSIIAHEIAELWRSVVDRLSPHPTDLDLDMDAANEPEPTT